MLTVMLSDSVFADILKAVIKLNICYVFQDAWYAFHINKPYVTKFMKPLLIGRLQNCDTDTPVTTKEKVSVLSKIVMQWFDFDTSCAPLEWQQHAVESDRSNCSCADNVRGVKNCQE
jgi:hypothetical protein